MKLEYVNKHTGEVTNLKDKFNLETDKATMTSTNLDLTREEVIALRGTTNAMTAAQVSLGIATGIALGKGIFTGACIAIGSAIIYDMVTPTDMIYKQVLKIKTK